jgi:hypothetical protein
MKVLTWDGTGAMPSESALEEGPILGLKLSLFGPVAELTEPVQRDLELLQRSALLQPRQRGILMYALPL